MLDNRRRTQRMQVEDQQASAFLVTPNRRIPVLIADESVHGVGVIAVNASSSDFPIDTPVSFESNVRTVESRIAHARSSSLLDCEVCRVGLEWLN